jgi:ABC-type glycerol-3-phosphate transport system substrate-binding protein
MFGRYNVLKLLAIAVIFSILATACVAPAVPASTQAPAETEQVTIRVLSYSQAAEAFNAINDEFMKRNPDIKISYEPVPYDAYYEKLGAYISTKSGPDVILLEPGFPMWERKDALLELNDRLTPDVVGDLLGYQWGCEFFDTNKKCMALPMSFNGNVMYFNKQILTEAGLDPENPPQTWEDFSKACDAIKSETGKACIAQGNGPVPLFWNWPELQKNFWESEQDIIDMGSGKIPWTDPKMAGGLKYMAEMVDKGWFQPGWETIAGMPDALDYFSSGEAAFIGSIISDVANWKQYGEALGDENVGVMPWPVIDENAPLAHKFSGFQGFGHGITAWSEHPDEAFRYLQFLVSADAANLFLELAGGQPNNKNFDRTIVTAPAFAKIQEIIPDFTIQSVTMLSSREQDALARGFQEYGTKDITLDDWINMMQEALDNSPEKKQE